jgi:Flp pilus assembly protein TadG
MLVHATKSHALTGRKNGCRGGTLVELTLIGLIFLALLLAIADFGQFLFIQQAIVERARAAARWGAATDPTDSTAIQNMVLYLQPSAPAGRTPSFGLAPAMVAVSTADGGTPNYRLVVQISGFSYQTLSPYLAGTYRGTPVSVSVPLGPYSSSQ